ncbi:MAG: ATP-binding cassette domain-containing protein, partial [Spirochaetota bacterium]
SFCENDNPIVPNGSNSCPHCGSVWAVRDVSFCVRENEILGIVGESGSGKSTILEIINFDLAPTSGQVFFTGFRNGEISLLTANEQEQRKTREIDMGMVYQEAKRGIDISITAGGNVVDKLLATEARNVGAMRNQTNTLFERLELTGKIDRLPKTFSVGMQQRVQIAKALVNKPSILLLDEPTTGLDVCVQARTLDLIRELQRELNIAILLVTHDWNVVRLLAKKVVVLRYGQIVEQGLTDQILGDPHHPYTQLLIASSL